MEKSCCHWWHAPFYFAMSITLAVIITTSFHSNDPTPPSSTNSTTQFIKHQLSSNASQVLRSHGFNIIATILHISPELFLSSPEFTIFAVQDRAISNALLPPWAMRQLLQYHTSPTKFTFKELLNKPLNSCLETLVCPKKTVITKSSMKQRLLQINNVLITHPDMFLEGPISIHGVLSPFSPLNHSINQDWDIIPSPICNFNLGQQHKKQIVISKNKQIEWPRMVKVLSSKGYVPFAMGLNSVLEEIIKEFIDLDSVTVLAPPVLSFVEPSSPLLQRIVKFHMLPQRFSLAELASLAVDASLRTLLVGSDLRVTKVSEILAVNGVEITAPDIFSSDKYVIHGISESFPVEDMELPIVFR